MTVGICCGADRAAEALAAGFDYAEVAAFNLAQTGPGLTALNIEATNLFFPSDMRLFEEPFGDWKAHATEAIEAAAGLGVKVMVIGSGRQRTTPKDPATGLKDFAQICGEISSLAAQHGITIAPEDLNRTETNVGNDMQALAEALRETGVAFTVDSYHVLMEADFEGREPDWAKEIPWLPAHAHFADLPRNVPSLDNAHTLGFLRRLKELGYDGRVSFEGSVGTMSLAEVADRLRVLWVRA